MGPKPGKSKSKDQARHLRRLSIAKKDDATLQKGPSITSFFKNTPPSKLACPLCGKFIPRFKINEHIDSQCRDYLEENDMQTTAVSDDEQTKTSCLSSKSVPNCPDEEKNASMHANNQEAKTSPYFKKSGMTRQESPNNNSHVGEVRIVSLGRLSSKLSKKALFPSEDSNSHSIQVSVKEDPVLSEPSSSQKENFENIHGKSEHVEMQSKLTSQVPTENLPHVEKIKQATPKKEPLGPGVSKSADTSASLRFMKRKKEESPGACVTPVVQKKTKYSGKTSAKSSSTDQLPEVVVSKSKHQDVETNQIMTQDGSSDPPHNSSASPVEHSSPRRPYYLQNFLSVLETVLENQDDRCLFSEEELSSIQRFKQMSGREYTLEHNYKNNHILWKSLKCNTVHVTAGCSMFLYICIMHCWIKTNIPNAYFLVPGQMLYVRLFQRKLKWLQVSKLDYTEISSDLNPVVQELVSSGFLQTGW